jgi:hypothetical protein
MVGAMETRRLSKEVVPREKYSFRSIFYPSFESKSIENKYIQSYLTTLFPSNHRLLVLILIIDSLINFFEILLFKSIKIHSSKLIHLSLFGINILVNLLSLIIINRIRNRLLSNLISLICLTPLIILSCLYPMECHVYILLILLYTLCNICLILSILISIIITIIISILTLESKRCLILFLIINLIGIYLNRLFEITNRSSYDQLCKSKFK